MLQEIFALPGRIADRVVEGAVIGANSVRQGYAWFANVNRLRILGFTERRYPKCYEQMDGGDKRIMRAFLDPDSVSNTYSLLGGRQPPRADSEFGLSGMEVVRFFQDTLGSEAAFDNSFVDRQPGADSGPERWFFVNGIATSRELARRNVATLHAMFKRPFTLIHNPTQSLTDDLVEAALQKFTNINSEPVARAFLEIANALLEPTVKKVVVVAHSQGTIIMGDVLDLVYCSIDRKYFDRTNMNDEDFADYMGRSAGTVKSNELREIRDKLKEKGPSLLAKLELYMFANAASRMCYIDESQKFPHIESYANEHDIVTRLGSLARDDFHKEDLIRIDGSLFTLDRYGHLLNAHYLPDFVAGNYQLRADVADACVGTSVHDKVLGNPCLKHPKYQAGQPRSRLFDYYKQAQNGGGPRPPAGRRRIEA
jgi:hypothetical protein